MREALYHTSQRKAPCKSPVPSVSLRIKALLSLPNQPVCFTLSPSLPDGLFFPQFCVPHSWLLSFFCPSDPGDEDCEHLGCLLFSFWVFLLPAMLAVQWGQLDLLGLPQRGRRCIFMPSGWPFTSSTNNCVALLCIKPEL